MQTTVMELLGSLANPEVQERLQQLSDRLDRLAASDAPLRPSGRVDQRIRPGAVLQALNQVLRSTDQPMQISDLHAAVSSLLGTVSYSAIKRCLTAGIHGKDARFERVAKGCYRLRRSI
jgi:hypothetical protein